MNQLTQHGDLVYSDVVASYGVMTKLPVGKESLSRFQKNCGLTCGYPSRCCSGGVRLAGRMQNGFVVSRATRDQCFDHEYVLYYLQAQSGGCLPALVPSVGTNGAQPSRACEGSSFTLLKYKH